MIKDVSLLLHQQYIALQRVYFTPYSRNHGRPSKKKECSASANKIIFPNKRMVEYEYTRCLECL